MLLTLTTPTLARAALVIGSKNADGRYESTPEDKQVTRRGIVCMLGLAGSAGLTGVIGPNFGKGTKWNPGKKTLEVDIQTRSYVSRLLEIYKSVLPGMATNLGAAKLIDITSDYVRAYYDLPKTNDPTYTNTVMKANMMLIGQVALAALVPNSGNGTVTNASIQKWMENPVASSFEVSVFGPLFEETMFRLLPSVIGESWKVGTVSSLAFAAMHLGGKRIPVAQFIGGMFFWYLMRERGFTHAVLAHSANNNAAMIAAMLNSKFP